jgi:hypothetical protein
MKSLMESKNVGEDAVKDERINIQKIHTYIYVQRNFFQFFQMLKSQCEVFFLWWLQMQVVNARSQNLNL